MYYFAEDLARDNVKKVKQVKKHKAEPNYRVYQVINKTCKHYQARGYWTDNNGKLYKDKINFLYYNDYKTALKIAYNILSVTEEQAVSIEDLKNKILYIITEKVHVPLKIKYIYKTLNSKQGINKIKEWTASNGGATLEVIKGYYVITSFKNA